jgi:DNA polymerase elongation subunit (family B)
MYQNIFIDKKENVVHLWDDEKGYVTFPFRNYAYRKSPNGIYRSIYGDKLEKVYNFNPRDPSLFESDVPMETRILIDASEDSDEPSKGHRVVTIDIEVSSEGGFPVIEEGDKEITAIAIYDDATKQYTAFILDKEMKLKDSVSDGVDIKSYDNEESLLMHFFTKWEEIQPTIVTGWNIDNFDMVYLYNRAKRVVGETNAKRLSPIGICYFNKFL